jgi:hypothetical protein
VKQAVLLAVGLVILEQREAPLNGGYTRAMGSRVLGYGMFVVYRYTCLIAIKSIQISQKVICVHV